MASWNSFGLQWQVAGCLQEWMQENDLQANKHWHFTLRNGRSTFMVNLSNYKKKPEFAFITRILDKFDIRIRIHIRFISDTFAQRKINIDYRFGWKALKS